MQDILALSPTFGRFTHSMRYAGELAIAFDAVLTGLFVSEPIPVVGMPMFPEMYTLATDIAQEATQSATNFQQWARSLGIKHAQWLVAQGLMPNALAQAANQHDLAVLEAGRDSVWGSPSILGKILLTCGLPCIVVPQAYSAKAAFDTIALAWNGSPEAARAVHAALPLLKRAQRVVLIHGERVEPFSALTWYPPLTIENYLARHEIRYTRQDFNASGDTAGRELLVLAQRLDANLLVMGAYGHTRFSEWMLGGATLYALEHAALPLFLRH